MHMHAYECTRIYMNPLDEKEERMRKCYGFLIPEKETGIINARYVEWIDFSINTFQW